MDPATLLWFALSVFRVADKIGIDGHVSFFPPKKKTHCLRLRIGRLGTDLLHPAFHTGVGLTACLDGLPRLLCACRLRRKGLVTRQSQAYPASARGPSPHVSPRRHLCHRQGCCVRWRAGVRGRNRSSDRYGAGAPACLRRQACSCPSHSDVLSHAWCQACVELCLLGREGPMLG